MFNIRPDKPFNSKASPAKQLVGLELPNGWKVVKPIPKAATHTGGLYSYGYIVSREDEQAFLKALDFFGAFEMPNATLVLQNMTEAYNYECSILEECRDRGLSNVVHPIEKGELMIEGHPLGRVPYIILELGEGDVRRHLDQMVTTDVTWIFKTLHGVAKGLRQLHSTLIAHQDLKLSNVLMFSDGDVAKVGDLGTATRRGHGAAKHDLTKVGDPAYSPFEILYGHEESDWYKRCISCDLYLLGSLVSSLILKVGMTAAVERKLDPQHRWQHWSQSYQAVLPYLVHAYNAVIVDLAAEFKRLLYDDSMAERAAIVVRTLCHPDPKLRGHPAERRRDGNPYLLDRYVSELALLAQRAAVGIWRMR